MPTFRFKVKEVVVVDVEVEADSLDEAVEIVEDGFLDGAVEQDSYITVTHYAIEGVMGWNKMEGVE